MSFLQKSVLGYLVHDSKEVISIFFAGTGYTQLGRLPYSSTWSIDDQLSIES